MQGGNSMLKEGKSRFLKGTSLNGCIIICVRYTVNCLKSKFDVELLYSAVIGKQ